MERCTRWTGCLRWLQPQLQAIDLSLNVSKCHIFIRGDTSHLPNLRAVPVSIGSGSDQYVQSALTTKFAKAIAFYGQVARLNDPQINLLLLLQRCSGVCRAASSEGPARCHLTILSAS